MYFLNIPLQFFYLTIISYKQCRIEEFLRITCKNLTGTGFVRMCEEYSLTEESDTWQRVKLGRLKILNGTIIIQ